VIGEALACEVPVVATDVGDAGRILDGVGTVVASGNVGALAEAVAAELLHPRDGQRWAALRTSIQQRFNLYQHEVLFRLLPCRCL
jgi:glycosyltransferase involved in cell wall biosynthesis